MRFHHKINEGMVHFVTMAVIGWIDVFTRENHKIKNYKFWQDGNKPTVLYSPEFTHQKLNYIHQNPVKERIVEEPHEYLFSSARNYAGKEGLIDVILIGWD